MTSTIQHNKYIVKLELLGIGSKRYLLLKEILSEALLELGMDIPINEVKEIDRILEYDIFGIPAIILNNKVIFQDQVPPKEDILAFLKERFAEQVIKKSLDKDKEII